MPDTPQTSEQARRRIAAALLMQGADYSPVQHWTQGLARVAQGFTGGLLMGQADQEERAREATLGRIMAQHPLLAAAAQPAAATVPTPSINTGPQQPGVSRLTTALMSGGQPSVAPRAEVMPSATMWGDKEAEAAGIYPSAQPPQPRPAQPGPAPMATPVQPTPAPTTPPTPGQGPTPPILGQSPPIDPQMAQYIRGLVTGPNATRETRAYGTQLLGQHVKPTTPTDEMREYDLYRRQGGTLPFFDYKAELKKAGATKVSIDQRSESKFREKAGSLIAERFNDYVKAGDEAEGSIADLNNLREIGARVSTGKTAQVTAALGPYAEALGVKIDSLGDLQAYNAIVAKMAPRMRVPGSGATSDFEMRAYLEGLPGLGKTPQGNEIIANTNEAILQHRRAVAEIASRAMGEELTPRQAEKMIRELPDPLALWKQSRGVSPAASPEMRKKIMDKYGLE